MDKKHKKKLKRAAKKKKDKVHSKQQQEQIKKQMGMFNRLPERCSACDKRFPKTREAHMAWRVVGKTEKEKVWLFCPECQQKAKELAEGEKDGNVL